MEKDKIMESYNYKVMTLQESIQKLKDIAHQSDVLYIKMHEEYLHAEENKKLYKRWLNTRGEKLRQELSGEKKWEKYLELLPHPDKPFDINDVKDEKFRSYILEVEKLEDEDHRIFSYILDTFNSKEEMKIIKEYLSERFTGKQQRCGILEKQQEDLGNKHFTITDEQQQYKKKIKLFMELKEHLQRFLFLNDKKNELLDIIQQNHIHNSNDELVFHRYKNKDNIWLREHIQRGIDKGKKWTQLLDNFPLPDKPFDIADIQDTEMKKCFMELEKIEEEEDVLGKYIRSTFEPTKIIKQFDHILEEKYNHETMDHTNN